MVRSCGELFQTLVHRCWAEGEDVNVTFIPVEVHREQSPCVLCSVILLSEGDKHLGRVRRISFIIFPPCHGPWGCLMVGSAEAKSPWHRCLWAQARPAPAAAAKYCRNGANLAFFFSNCAYKLRYIDFP